MNRIQHIYIGGFRRLRDIQLSLHPLNVIIGANGIGKTSFLEVLSLLAASADGKLQTSLSALGGLNTVLSYSPMLGGKQPMDSLTIHLEFEPSSHLVLEYTLKIEAMLSGYSIKYEKLDDYHAINGKLANWYINNNAYHVEELLPRAYHFDNVITKPTWPYSSLESALSDVPKTIVVAEQVRQHFASGTLFTPINVGSRSPVRLPQPMSPASMPGKNGEELVSYLYTLRENYPERFSAIEDTLAAAFPDFERIGFPPVAAGVLAMTWKDKSFDKPMYMNQLSEGTLRFLWLASLLQSPDLPAITMIDEPEVSLHPELLSLLAQLLREASERSQIFVATHSDRLIRFLKPSEVLVMDNEDGYAKMTWADSMDIEHWLEDYSLDEVWQMGQIGGRA